MVKPKRWQPHEEALIFDYRYTTEQLSKMLGRTVEAIYHRRKVLRYSKQSTLKWQEAQQKYYKSGDDSNSYRRWTQAEDRTITDPGRPSDKQLSYKLGRSIKAIELRRHKLLSRDCNCRS